MNNHLFLALGSNVGDREHYLSQAVEKLKQEPEIDVLQLSSIYETAPVGVTEQPPFLNMVIAIKTGLEAHEVLGTTQKIEQDLDRVREKRWGPRTIDLDILLFNDENIKMEDLYIPHPRICERAFVLIPLNEIAENNYVSKYSQYISDMTSQLSDREKEGVHLWKSCSGPGGFGLFES
ncbi:2-amino-4-hydroxy-6-hydroxymethyldihydropteridine diphosphokinase [Salibacterium salarium]|uniref:2-amino-4-hydroxy-6-hydroxymethyldihydropteridine diphosphokinase n=1 Tax=Salibacterium salarium TaxID=284579 RepID=A0A3R9WM69_9BACI|nr:2-amino-4-hydroxy-6-hydroxymethyldihydropteridine diphosphokinase [Salibacterium salarium]RSL29325.1 2-amino-4-hydroxy-6-hydroxymethyldihydropteridine diphosphokinase [Salibacterium salarium]